MHAADGRAGGPPLCATPRLPTLSPTFVLTGSPTDAPCMPPTGGRVDHRFARPPACPRCRRRLSSPGLQRMRHACRRRAGGWTTALRDPPLAHAVADVCPHRVSNGCAMHVADGRAGGPPLCATPRLPTLSPTFVLTGSPTDAPCMSPTGGRVDHRFARPPA